MYRICTYLMLLCLTATTTWAAPIGERQARAIAARFMQSHAMPAASLTTAYKAPLDGTAAAPAGGTAYYVFNAAQAGSGYVIVAADDRVPSILGYSDNGTFDPNDVPPVMQEWLDGYALQIQAIAGGAKPDARSAARQAIAPMLNVRWGQGMPYSVLFPHVNGSDNAHAYVGCVAVAMAQIMAYWRYPARPVTTIPGYTSNSGRTYAVTMPPLQPIDFDWENMHETYYTNDSTSESCMAVANLMLYSSTSLKSNFGLTSTGSYTRYIPEKLITYFGYKNSAHYIYRSGYTTQTWEDTIYAELAAGRPVAYGGNKQTAGHAFVCDGYDGEGRFHINWGWAGKSNGYFLLNLLNPSDEGIGSAAGAYGYVYNQGAAIGLEPDDGAGGTAVLSFDGLTISSQSATRSASTSSFGVSVSGRFINNTNVASQFRQGWGLYKDGELIEVLFTRYSTSALGNGEYITVSSRALSFGAGITSGTYRILPIYSIYPGSDYRPCSGSDVNYIEVTFGGDYSCTIKGYGEAGSTTRYTVNHCDIQGTLNHGKPVTMTLNVKNAGTSTNDMVYMYVNGTFNAMGLANIAPGESGDIVYRFTPSTAGSKTVTFSLNESGSSPFYTHTVAINTMPQATLDVDYRIMGITDEANRIITAPCYSIIVDVTNTGTAAYDEDFSVRLYRINNDDTNVGTELHSLSQPLQLAPGETKSLQFDFDHDLIDGWKYFCYLYYYSGGETVGKGTRWYYLNMGDEPFIPTTRYTVTVAATPVQGGEFSLAGNFVGGKIKAGETVTVTARPNVGWQVDGIGGVTTGDDSLDVATVQDGGYSFVMPDADVTLTVNFSRSTGSTFKLVTSRDSISPDGIYVIASKYYDKVMKFHEQGEATFGATAVGQWLDEDKTLMSIDDKACMFTMPAMNPDTIRAGATSGARTNAFLSTGNGFLTTSGGNLVMSASCTSQCRAAMFVSSNEFNYLVRFFNEASGASSDYMTVRYDYQNEQFRIINYSSDTQQRVWLYKLVETPQQQYQLGDVNQDGYINVADVTTLIGLILDNTAYDPDVADVNHDGSLNVADVTTLIAMILSM